MRFATLKIDGREQACLMVASERWVPLNAVDVALQGDLLTLIRLTWPFDRLQTLEASAAMAPSNVSIDRAQAEYCPPYRSPAKILGIGLNYMEHATDLGETSPEEPASFFKGHHTIIGHSDTILLPSHSNRVTCEAELGVIMGVEAADVPVSDAMNVVFGFCLVLDQTAEDILQRNPRFLTRSKNYPTFFSFGPEVVTPDEFLSSQPLSAIRVTTVVGEETRTNVVSQMRHSPASLISLHSEVMPWFPGDILSTGTPGAVRIEHGDTAICQIDDLVPLVNPVVRPSAITR